MATENKTAASDDVLARCDPSHRDMAALYDRRLARYTTAMRNEMPDAIPIRPFVAEFTGVYAGYTCQELAHDYEKAFAAARKCAADFDWDAVVANMVYVWTGLAQAVDLKYYGIPGIDIPPDMGFQYREPPQGEAFMRANEYDQLIEDPTGFLLNVWLPRVSHSVSPMGSETSEANNLSFLKGGMAMMQYFGAFPGQISRLREESGTVSAIAGIFKAPLDIIADKLRGYLGLVDDLFERPEKVMAACEALMPHLYGVAKATADPQRNVPIGYWMHRGCVPFISFDQFDRFYWPTVKPIIEDLWSNGHQTLFYAEGNWDHHLESFAQLPECSIVYHVDQGDIFKVHKALGEKFCLSGGIPNVALGHQTADDVRAYCKKVIDEVAGNGGYIMDAAAIVQNDAKVENMRAMTDFTRDYGVYSQGSSRIAPPKAELDAPPKKLVPSAADTLRPPGTCVPWKQKSRDLPELQGDAELTKTIWENLDALANMYVWQMLLSF